mmetsp:Transcript_2551/g.4738  ORF Transcript_2551/g.4738 Transcript_2551/m.4738 type:complete len:194 (-) Transcript_2551:3-584(-)
MSNNHTINPRPDEGYSEEPNSAWCRPKDGEDGQTRRIDNNLYVWCKNHGWNGCDEKTEYIGRAHLTSLCKFFEQSKKANMPKSHPIQKRILEERKETEAKEILLNNKFKRTSSKSSKSSLSNKHFTPGKIKKPSIITQLNPRKKSTDNQIMTIRNSSKEHYDLLKKAVDERLFTPPTTLMSKDPDHLPMSLGR